MNIYYEFREVKNTASSSRLMNIPAIVKYVPPNWADKNFVSHPGYACILDGYSKTGDLYMFMSEWTICETTAGTLSEFQEENPEYFL